MRYYVVSLVFLIFATNLFAAQITMQDGRTIEGETSRIAKVERKIKADDKPQSKMILLVDDGLRRLFVPIRQVVNSTSNRSILESFKFDQRYATVEVAGVEYASLGTCRPEPFDEFGRRLVAMAQPGGTDYETQAIVEINSRYIRTRGVKVPWDARYSILTVPRSILSPILMNKIDPENFDDRRRIFRLYLEAQYYEAAREELEKMIEDFKSMSDPKQDEVLTIATRRVRTLEATRFWQEMNMRYQAGQHALVSDLLRNYRGEGVPALTMQEIRGAISRIDAFGPDKENLIARLREYNEQITDVSLKEKSEKIIAEIESQLTLNTIERFGSFTLQDRAPELSVEEKLAIGLSSWLVGKDTPVQRLAVAVSMAEVRDLIRDYLRAEFFNETQDIYDKILEQEAGTADLVSQLLKLIQPPIVTPVTLPDQPGYFELQRPGIPHSGDFETIEYCIQLPPEYDPNRSYPMIVAMHASSGSPQQELQWWCGPWRNGMRYGHAGRYGYIVLSPKWAYPGQMSYDNSPLVHGAVLFALRDALGRFNIDTDRIFLSGHEMGGTAAWDIGMAHPDLWAGVIPFCAAANLYTEVYDTNAEHLPLYFVSGELDSAELGGRLENKLVVNGRSYNHYLGSGYNTTVVQYIGRGPELYGEEVPELFKWMNRLQRTVPKTYTVKSFRPLSGFYFFWGVEYPNLPDEQNWPLDNRGRRSILETSCRYLEPQNKMIITTNARFNSVASPDVYLTREMIDFNRRVDVEFNNKKFQPRSGFLEPDLRLILEDARTRKDRAHPFWVRLNSTTRQ